jgi:hypothetical protein
MVVTTKHVANHNKELQRFPKVILVSIAREEDL